MYCIYAVSHIRNIRHIRKITLTGFKKNADTCSVTVILDLKKKRALATIVNYCKQHILNVTCQKAGLLILTLHGDLSLTCESQ